MKERFAREIVSSFPYPIAALFRRLGTKECKAPGEKRLKNILAIGGAVGRLCGMITLCECREYIERTHAQAPKSLSNDFARMFKRPSWGSWMQIAREGMKWLRSEEEELCCSEMVDFYLDQKGKESAAIQSLGKLLTMRNELSHDKLDAMYVHQLQEVCETAFALLEPVLEGLDFLLDYELTYVGHIEVQKQRKCEAEFLHSFMAINGHDYEFMADDVIQQDYMETGTIVLRSMDSGKYLNLDPLLVYEEAAGRAADVFFYNGMKHPRSVEFSACKQGGTFNSAATARVEGIGKELESLLACFGQEKESEDAV